MELLNTIKDYYDVIIVGAGISGLTCAKILCNSGLDVLVVEKNKDLGKKICAGGITFSDLEYLPKRFNFTLKKMLIHYRNRIVVLPESGGIISTISREKLSKNQLDYLRRVDNIRILTGVAVKKIISDNSLELSSGQKINFKFLVGADGAISVVRRYLGVPTERLEIGLQCIIPEEFGNFEVYLDDKLFGTGFLWIFPNKNFTSIGCGSDIRFMSPKKLKNNFDIWLKKNKIDISNAKIEGTFLNYDYRGYRFGNIFLAGDAAGLTSGLTGKGIYSAFLSGEQIARDILQKDNPYNLITNWLNKKRRQEKYIFFLKNFLLRNIFFAIGIRIISYKGFQERFIKLII